MSLKAVIFDLDGTLIDSEIYNFKAWQKLLNNYNQQIDLPEYARNFAGQSKEYIAKKVEEVINKTDLEIIKEKDSYYYEFLEEIPIKEMPFAKSILENLSKKNIILACATGGGRNEALSKLDYLDFTKYFDSIVTKSDVKNTKPDPETYLKSLSNLNLQTSDVIAVEDTVTGYDSGVAAGIRTFIVKNEMNKYMDFATEDVVENLKGLWNLIQDGIIL
jgi:beta-phosphoglucomutase